MKPSRFRFVALVIAVVAFAGVLAAVSPTAASPSYPADLTIRGSVKQLYVLNAAPSASIHVVGPSTNLTQTANARGARLFRDLPAGSYTVTAGTAPPQVVQVHDDTYRPAQTFYADPARSLATDAAGTPTDGYLETADGTLLGYRVDLPATAPPSGKYDVVVVYSGYRAGLRPAEVWEDGDNSPWLSEPYKDQPRGDGVITKLLALGYAVVGVNMRGTGCSGGAFDVMEPLVGLDGYDIIETLNAQSWVDNVAMAGASWLGLSQLFVAQTQPPHLDAIVPGATVVDFYRDALYTGGIPQVGFPRSVGARARRHQRVAELVRDRPERTGPVAPPGTSCARRVDVLGEPGAPRPEPRRRPRLEPAHDLRHLLAAADRGRPRHRRADAPRRFVAGRRGRQPARHPDRPLRQPGGDAAPRDERVARDVPLGHGVGGGRAVPRRLYARARSRSRRTRRARRSRSCSRPRKTASRVVACTSRTSIPAAPSRTTSTRSGRSCSPRSPGPTRAVTGTSRSTGTGRKFGRTPPCSRPNRSPTTSRWPAPVRLTSVSEPTQRTSTSRPR